MTDVLMKRGNLDTHTYTQGECYVNVKAEIWVMCLQAKKSQKLPAKHQMLGDRHEAVFLTTLRRNYNCQNLDLELLTSKTMRQCISVI